MGFKKKTFISSPGTLNGVDLDRLDEVGREIEHFDIGQDDRVGRHGGDLVVAEVDAPDGGRPRQPSRGQRRDGVAVQVDQLQFGQVGQHRRLRHAFRAQHQLRQRRQAAQLARQLAVVARHL